jgi:hypothetical protein
MFDYEIEQSIFVVVVHLTLGIRYYATNYQYLMISVTVRLLQKNIEEVIYFFLNSFITPDWGD